MTDEIYDRDQRAVLPTGAVNFPVGNAAYRNTGEGGLSVLLSVLSDTTWRNCFGPGIHVQATASLINDDQPKTECVNPDCPDCPFRRERGLQMWNNHHIHFPSAHTPRSVNEPFTYRESCLSVEYIAVVELGNASWSGWDEKQGKYWHCTYDDLTPAGRSLYDLLQSLHPDRTLILQTWLDT